MKKLHQKTTGQNKSQTLISPVTAKAALEAWQDRKGIPRDVKRKPFFGKKKP